MKKSLGFDLFTIGYAAHTPASLVATLKKAKVSLLLDVRELPVSRRKGFSKSTLNEYLQQNGIEYRHIKPLGVPAELRNRYRAGEVDKITYMESFRNILVDSNDVLHDVYSVAREKKCCLLCLEEHHADCHRTIVAAEIAKVNGMAVRIVHL